MSSENLTHLEEGVEAFEKDTQATQLTPLQRAARPIVYIFVCATMVSLIAVVAVWVMKLPAVPPPNADEKTIATYRELTAIAGGSAKDLLEEIFTKALLPLLLAFGGVLVGKNLKKDTD